MTANPIQGSLLDTRIRKVQKMALRVGEEMDAATAQVIAQFVPVGRSVSTVTLLAIYDCQAIGMEINFANVCDLLYGA